VFGAALIFETDSITDCRVLGGKGFIENAK
jgi:hypothetical protein